MNHALILNLAILAVVLIALFATMSPLVLLGIAFLREMPYGLLQSDEEVVSDEDEDDEQSKPIGFVQN